MTKMSHTKGFSPLCAVWNLMFSKNVRKACHMQLSSYQITVTLSFLYFFFSCLPCCQEGALMPKSWCILDTGDKYSSSCWPRLLEALDTYLQKEGYIMVHAEEFDHDSVWGTTANIVFCKSSFPSTDKSYHFWVVFFHPSPRDLTLGILKKRNRKWWRGKIKVKIMRQTQDKLPVYFVSCPGTVICML